MATIKQLKGAIAESSSQSDQLVSKHFGSLKKHFEKKYSNAHVYRSWGGTTVVNMSGLDGKKTLLSREDHAHLHKLGLHVADTDEDDGVQHFIATRPSLANRRRVAKAARSSVSDIEAHVKKHNG